MEKVNFAFGEMKQEKKVFNMGGIEVTAVNKIPYNEKAKCAAFMAARRVMKDENHPGVLFRSLNSFASDMQAYLMFYTNANVEGMSLDAIRRMHDNLCDDQGFADMLSYTLEDRDIVENMTWRLVDALHDIEAAKANKAFDMSAIVDAFMADPDPDGTIAKNRELNEKLIDAMRTVKK